MTRDISSLELGVAPIREGEGCSMISSFISHGASYEIPLKTVRVMSMGPIGGVISNDDGTTKVSAPMLRLGLI